MAFKIFGKSIEPACEYCSHGKPSADRTMIMCLKKGVMNKYDRCKKFSYDPLLREPKVTRELPKYTEDDFKID